MTADAPDRVSRRGSLSGAFSRRRFEEAAAPRDFGPFDDEDLDPEVTDPAGRVDFGAVRVPVPTDGTVTVEPTAGGRLQAVHVTLPQGRLSVSALAAPKSGDLWPELASEIDTSLRDGGARVRSFQGDWGRELHARTGAANSVFIGVDGARWMVYGVATGPGKHAVALEDALRTMLRGTIVCRGRSPYPVRTVLPLTIPAHLADDEDVAGGATSVPAPPSDAAGSGVTATATVRRNAATPRTAANAPGAGARPAPAVVRPAAARPAARTEVPAPAEPFGPGGAPSAVPPVVPPPARVPPARVPSTRVPPSSGPSAEPGPAVAAPFAGVPARPTAAPVPPRRDPVGPPDRDPDLPLWASSPGTASAGFGQDPADPAALGDPVAGDPATERWPSVSAAPAPPVDDAVTEWWPAVSLVDDLSVPGGAEPELSAEAIWAAAPREVEPWDAFPDAWRPGPDRPPPADGHDDWWPDEGWAATPLHDALLRPDPQPEPPTDETPAVEPPTRRRRRAPEPEPAAPGARRARHGVPDGTGSGRRHAAPGEEPGRVGDTIDLAALVRERPGRRRSRHPDEVDAVTEPMPRRDRSRPEIASPHDLPLDEPTGDPPDPPPDALPFEAATWRAVSTARAGGDRTGRHGGDADRSRRGGWDETDDDRRPIGGPAAGERAGRHDRADLWSGSDLPRIGRDGREDLDRADLWSGSDLPRIGRDGREDLDRADLWSGSDLPRIGRDIRTDFDRWGEDRPDLDRPDAGWADPSWSDRPSSDRLSSDRPGSDRPGSDRPGSGRDVADPGWDDISERGPRRPHAAPEPRARRHGRNAAGDRVDPPPATAPEGWSPALAFLHTPPPAERAGRHHRPGDR